MIGIIGLGEMGGGMMKRLLLAGAKPAGYNRTKSKAQSFIDRGMEFADSPHALTEMCDVVISMVTNNEALVSIASGPKGVLSALGPGKIWIEMSTVAPHIIQSLGERAAKTGGTLLDGAVLGSPLTIEQGKLLIMLAGDESACEKVKPELLKIGPTVRRIGEIGHAKVMKVALNLNMPVQILALSEGLLLAEKSGIPREVALEVMLGGVIASPMLAYRAPFILNMPEKAWFDVKMMQKDLNLALELAEEVNVPLPTTALANQMLTSARAQGLAEYDFAVLFYALARTAGLDVSPSR
ncbi:MAG TPA: NAD(P)-dependent oxidoreductase [Candidatus Acidoferrales bacterium]|nr:NAD(P)-dependent oxidoreductase [Candidatus Acidoferrales bacterium]